MEPERYELQEIPRIRFDLERRDFLKAVGGGILIAVCLPEVAAREFGQRMPQDIAAWLHIGEDGAVTVYTGKVEMGQNIRTSLSQVVAEELRVPLESIHLVMGDTDLTPFDMGTFGSMTTPVMAPQLRKAAAAARELLLDQAAEFWKTDRNALTVSEGKITHSATKQVVGYGALTKGLNMVKTISGNEPTTPADQWRIAGKSIRKIDGRYFVTGRHKYSSDIQLPGMLYGKVLRPPAFGAELVSLDTKEAEAIPGVTIVHDDSFVGAAAPDEATASRAIAAIRAEWKTTPQPSKSELFDYLKKQANAPQTIYQSGSIEEGLAKAAQKLNQTYTVDYIAHAPLEPRAAVAQWEADKLTVRTGTQRPFGVRGELAQAFHLPEEKVHVIMPDTGSGYGGKHMGDAAVEAARLARAAGKPVKIVWTRREEFTWAYYRPAGVIEVSGGIASDGTLTAWEFRNYNSGAAGIRSMYEIPNQRVEFYPTQSPLRQGSYRCLAATANHFARETHIDELAHLAKMDPLEFRLKNLKDPRFLAVLKAAADKFGWGKKKTSPNQGFGIAGGFEKGSYMATCAEIAVDRASGKVTIIRVVEAFECGAILNPDHLKNQVEGMIVMGIGGALFESIDFENGKILNPLFSRYRVPRFSDIPVLEVVLLDRKDLPSAGGGETPIVGIAPALGNAIYDAVGIRLRSLPLAPNGVKL